MMMYHLVERVQRNTYVICFEGIKKDDQLASHHEYKEQQPIVMLSI